MSGLNRIQLLPARDRVAAALREAILTHQFEEGQELTLKETAQTLGVSVTPVREAFQILQREGLINLRPNRGAVVLGMNEKRIRDHFEIRAALERAAVIAACRGSDLSAVRAAFDRASQCRPEEYSSGNEAFHRAIWSAADNEQLEELLSGLWNGLSMGPQVTKGHYADISMAEHATIMAAMEAHDADRAGSLMEAHIQRSMENILEHLKQ